MGKLRKAPVLHLLILMACQLPNAIAIDCRTPDCKSMAKSKNNGKKETDTTAESTWRIRGVAGWTDRQAFVFHRFVSHLFQSPEHTRIHREKLSEESD